MSGTVYFVTTAEGKRVKIGYTRHDPRQRLRELQCGSPFELCIIATEPGSASDERMLHERFAGHRLHGEWFEMTVELKQHIIEVNRQTYEQMGGESPRWARLFNALANGATAEEADAA